MQRPMSDQQIRLSTEVPVGKANIQQSKYPS